jgi:hypothetical protein
MRQILTIGLLVTVGAAVGCSGSHSGDQPKAANPQGNPKLKIQGDGPPAAPAERATPAAKD